MVCDQPLLLQYLDLARAGLHLVSHLLTTKLCGALDVASLSGLVFRRLAHAPVELPGPGEARLRSFNEDTLAVVERVVSSRFHGVVTPMAVASLAQMRRVQIRYTDNLAVRFLLRRTQDMDVTRESHLCPFFWERSEQGVTLWVMTTSSELTPYEILSLAVTEVGPKGTQCCRRGRGAPQHEGAEASDAWGCAGGVGFRRSGGNKIWDWRPCFVPRLRSTDSLVRQKLPA
jgi:hypothetical protein